ncbi:MAG: hypothetical protein EAZ25_13920 [Oscillatoriales cyanobacterium]|nr:MAG: hypothetical protein EAZ88_23545 [Oscillatoriales cyanobacterium]TAG62092.1 MAG: hypothetical protein EAZ28_03530 [Oscillatoriales cyanobacterium]TAG65903.1 MAG: hypothetical protein EAZ25_13920 [Oscillatoriales cyanobacterium]TAG70704.1 MAG: hypothetical protein EAZ23_21500 [Oscillatoriales cyanobacterium]TAH14824.1 MAG: hypothetical protein EAZ10_22625 [Oscillatoriales cyanobacterium]
MFIKGIRICLTYADIVVNTMNLVLDFMTAQNIVLPPVRMQQEMKERKKKMKMKDVLKWREKAAVMRHLIQMEALF